MADMAVRSPEPGARWLTPEELKRFAECISGDSERDQRCLRALMATVSEVLGATDLDELLTYLVNKDGYMITESRFVQQLRDIGLVKRRCALELALINGETGELTNGVKQSIAGINGFDAKGYKDYRGTTVLGVWRWLPEYNWGVMAEIDKDEGYGPAYNLNYIVSSILIILVIPIVFVAYIIGKKNSAPIIQLTEVTKKIALGDLTQTVDKKGDDEIGILANSFNIMAKSLDEKTREIAESEKRYRELFNSVKEGVYQSEPREDGVFININQAGAEILGYKSPHEVIGRKVKDIYVDQDDRRKVVEKLTKDGIWRSFTSLCKRKNGEQHFRWKGRLIWLSMKRVTLSV